MSVETSRYFLPVADDVGMHPSINRGTYAAAEHEAITCADIMVAEPWAEEAMQELQRGYPEVSLGIHIAAFPDMHPMESGPKVFALRMQPNSPPALIQPLLRQTERQIRMYQDMVGSNPPHISSHDHAHQNAAGEVYPEFLEAVDRELGDSSASIVRSRDTRLVRHTRLTLLQKGEAPLSAPAFRDLLIGAASTHDVIELAAHPGVDGLYEPSLEPPFTSDMRQIDLDALLAITEQQSVRQAGLDIVTPCRYLAMRALHATVPTLSGNFS